MARFRRALRLGSGFFAAVLAAPFTVGLSLGVADWPRSGIDLPNTLAFALLAAFIASPASLLLALVLGIPSILFARSLLIGSARYYAGCGLAIGAVAGGLDVLQTHGNESALEFAAFVLGGVVSALTYWLVAERGRSREAALGTRAP